jgi:hypothetical protein
VEVMEKKVGASVGSKRSNSKGAHARTRSSNGKHKR